MNKIKRVNRVVFVILIFFSAQLQSDDTEIYLGGGTAIVEVKPNVLFVLDTSSSMTNKDGTGITRLQRMKSALNSILTQASNINVGMMRFHGEGGPVLYPVADIDANASVVEGTNNSIGLANSRISRGEDDAAEVSTIVITASSQLNLGITTDGIDQVVGLRFQNVRVPQGATITSATIEFEATGDESVDTSLFFKGEDHDDSAPFTTTENNISSRIKTTASVDWNSIPAWTDGSRYQSPDITSIIQEIVNRTGWCGNNALSILLEGTGLRNAKAFEASTTSAPKLNIEYDEDSVTDGACINEELQVKISNDTDDAEERENGSMYLDSSDLEIVQESSTQTIGLRFRNIRIPANTTILEAVLEFTVDETDSGTTSLRIRGENNTDAATFSSSENDITGRLKTSASVNWSPDSWDTVGEKKQTVDIKSIIQEIVNQNTWSPGNALALIIDGTGKRVADSYDGSASNAALLKIKIQGPLSSGSNTVRSRLKNIVDEIEYKSGTPLVDALYEAALYYRGGNVKYGTTRGNSINPSSSLNRSEYSRVSHPASYTGGTVVRAEGCTDATLNSDECITEHITGTATYKTPIAQSCQGNHIILLSDGYPGRNSSVDFIESLISPDSCSGSGAGKCGVELTDFLYSNDNKTGDGFDGDQNITTHTIGFNILASGKAYLEDLATAGGGEFHEASSSTDLVDAFQNIIGEILSHPTTFAAPSLSVNAFDKLYHNNEVYFSLFLPTNKKRWAGNLKKYKLCEGNAGDSCDRGEIIDANNNLAIGANHVIKDSAQSAWSLINDGVDVLQGGAGANVPDYDLRRIFTYTGASSPDNVSLSASTHLLTTDNAALTKTHLGDAEMSDGERTDLINWIRGKDVKDEDENDVVDENRWVFSDPLHGGSITIPYGYKHSIDAEGNILPTLDANEELVHITKILVPGNDGSLRMINSSTGVEEWAFIPQDLLLNQKSLMNNLDGSHIYGLDNTITYRTYDANNNGIIEPAGTDVNGNGSIATDEKDYVHIYVSMRRGGRNIYALDITPPSILTSATATDSISPKLIWRINGGSGNFSKLGQTWSKPQPAKISVTASGTSSKKEVLIFAGGYHTGQDEGFGVSGYGNAIYIVDALTGARLWWASDTGADVNHADMKYAIPSDLALMDSDGSDEIDRIYVGDTGGQLWRIDLNSVLNNSVISKLANISDQADDADVSHQRKFFYPPDIAQIEDRKYANTTLYDLIIIASGNRAHPLDTNVHDRIYAFRDTRIRNSDTAISTISDNSVNAFGESDDLFDATSNILQQGTSQEIEAAITSIKDKKGWFINLQEYNGAWSGEKGLASPLVLDGKLFYTTYVPGLVSSDPCAAAVEGGGYLYAIDLLNGAAVLDWHNTDNPDDDNLIKEDRRYQLGAGIPSEAIAIFQPTGVSVVVGSGGGGYVADPEVGLPKHRTFWMQEGLK